MRFFGKPARGDPRDSAHDKSHPDIQGAVAGESLWFYQYAAYQYWDLFTNENMHNLPDHRGLGTFIWEPTQNGNQQGLFDRTGAVIPEKMAPYDKVVKDYGLKN